MKKIQMFATTLLMGWALAFCSDFNIPDEPVIIEEDKENMSYISLRINTDFEPAPASRASMDPEYGTNGPENKVSAVRMVLYGAYDHIVKYAFDFKINSNDQHTGFFQEGIHPEYGDYLYNGNLGGSRFITFARPVANADYKMLLIVNSGYTGEIITPDIPTPKSGGAIQDNTNIIKVTEVGQPLSRFLEPVYMPDFSLGKEPIASAGFMMTNFKDLVDVPKSLLGDSADDANQNPIPVTVERIASKVQVEFFDPAIGILPPTPSGQIWEISWQLNTTNKWFFWMRQLAPVINADGSQGAMETLSDLDRTQLYAIDPNYSGMTNATGGNSAKRAAHFSYAANTALDEYGFFYLKNQVGEFSREYVLENTMAYNEQEEDVVTTVLVKLMYYPNGSFNYYDSYFVYNDTAISKLEMKDYATNPSLIPLGLAGLETAINNARSNPDEPRDFTDDSFLYNLNSGFETADGLKFYYAGYNYYSVKIRHSLSGDPNLPLYARYGIVRNNFYTVKLRSLSGYGSPVLTYPAAMSAQVSVQPWSKYAQEARIGEEGEVLNVNPYITYRYFYQESPGTNVLYKTYYNRNQTAGDPIDVSSAGVLNRYLSELNLKGWGTFLSGTVLTPPITANVSATATNNVVDILYSK